MILCLAPMALMGLESYFHQGQLNAGQVAKVGDTPIELAALQSEMNATRARLLETIPADAINEQALTEQTLKTMIDRTLLEEQAAALGMQVSDAAITAMLQAEPTFADADGKFSNDRFGAFLQQQGMTRDMLFAAQRRQINLRTLMNGVLATAIYTSPEVNRLMDLQFESRELWVKRLAWQDYADQVTVTDADINAYYEANKDTLIAPAMVDLSYVELSEDSVPVPELTQEELNAAYQTYLRDNNFGQKELAQILLTGEDAAKRAEEVLKALAAGESFESLAKTHSDDPSGKSGGAMGAYNPAVFGADASKVDAAIGTLEKGQTSTAVNTSFGTHIFKVVDMGDAPSLESVKDELIKTATAQKRTAVYGDMVATINGLVADGFGIKDIANEMKLSVKELPNYKETGQDILGQPAIVRAAFDEFTIADGSVSPNIDLSGTTLWLQPSNHRPSALMTPENASEEIKARLVKEKASQLALEAAKKEAATLTKDNLSGLTAVGMATRQTSVLSDAERASLFSTPASEGGIVAWAVQTDIGASVMAGGAVQTEAQSRMSPAEKSAAAAMMKNVAGQDLLEDYLHYLRTVHAVQTNDEALKTL